jgi:hypothetical protein
MNNSEPAVWIPGYQLTVPRAEPWSYVPRLEWPLTSRAIDLHAYEDDYRCQYWAVPAALHRDCKLRAVRVD